MPSNSFIKGTLMLTLANFVVKFIGAAQLIFLSRLLGGEGLGLYNIAFPMYLLAISVSSAGIPVALSILVAEKAAISDFYGAKRIFKVALSQMIIIGVLATVILYYGAGWLIENNIIRDSRAYYSIIALTPSVIFVTIIASFRGYFQGFQIMKPTAVSQIVEQLFRVITMLCLAYILLPYGLQYAAAGASFGAFAGAVAALSVLIYYYWKYRSYFYVAKANCLIETKEPWISINSRIMRLSLPVLLANVMAPIIANIDILIVPARLEVAGYSVQEATELFGYLTGMSSALINFPTVLTASLAVSLVPAISNALALGNLNSIHYRISEVIRLSVIILLPSFAGLLLLATPISQLLYNTPNAGNVIAILSIAILLLGLHQVTTAILHGLGRTSIPMLNMLIAALIKIGLSWVLTAMPEFGVNGAAWATNVDLGVAVSLNIYFVYRFVGLDISYKDIMKTVISTIVMGVIVTIAYRLVMIESLSNTLSTIISILSGCIIYFLCLILFRGLHEKDILRIPRIGEKIIRLKNKK
ncbi:polysaccharide biosynthesis protein [Pelosinus sp. UFO1]|uniref:putative polysaccharide biosynthesis protein n=1 Tax=Pelosinus sp. UFO1 TaxID=484770 RepID=UPI0004D1F7B6|nr:polysaccharide biosynthesis protein [Pelosinus sp. UFO1]AIF52937.1 polysaccharide biosynthesis protein [Pelosinus sp. UFO1]